MPEPLYPRAIAVIFNPKTGRFSPKRLIDQMRWNRPSELCSGYIRDIRDCSGGLVNYEVVDQLIVDELPVKSDGFRYGYSDFFEVVEGRAKAHNPDTADYESILSDLYLTERIQSGEADEIWFFGPPFAGFYESRMIGHNAVWCNGPAIERKSRFSRRFVVMGFNYQRGVGEMLEDLGHRAESILDQVFSHLPPEANLWKRFTRYDLNFPGQAEVGTVHFAPNSHRDYDWGNHQLVPSRCDDWLHYPDLNGSPRMVDCAEWGNGDIRLHHLWWFRHFPRLNGTNNGISNNWWEYFIRADHPFFDRPK